MIQRIQSIYLLATSVLVALIFVFPIAEYIDINNNIFQLTALKLQSLSQNFNLSFSVFPIAFFTGLVSILSLGAIFLFKNRKFQLRVTTFIIIILVFLFGLIGFYVYKFNIDLESKPSLNISAFFPLIAIITTYLAQLGIKKDIKIIRSIDRIR